MILTLKKDIVYNKSLRIEKKILFEVIRQYDAVMLHHSLEHMDKQQEVMEKLYTLLSPEGVLLIRIPIVSGPLMKEYGGNVVSLDPPRHFYIHSAKSIRLIVEQAGFKIDKEIYDAHEFSFWASEQYKKGINLHNHPESYLVKKTFSDEQMAEWQKSIQKLNQSGQSDYIALYLKKK